MSPKTRHYRGTVLRTALASLVLLSTGAVSAKERALHTQLQSVPEDALPALLERMTSAQLDVPTRTAAALSVARLLDQGHSDAVTDRALEVLGSLGAPSAGPVLSQYTQHRRPAARARAFAALGRVAGSERGLRQLVASGLRDSAPEVRAAAARALETLRAAEATPLLLRALGRGVPEAAVTLGAIGEPSSLDAYSDYLRKQPLEVMLGGYERYLQRPDVNEKSKLDIVARLEDVAGPAVLRFLSAVAGRPKLPAAVQQAASAAALRVAKAEQQRTAAGVKP